jgi:hypothetical protein
MRYWLFLLKYIILYSFKKSRYYIILLLLISILYTIFRKCNILEEFTKKLQQLSKNKTKPDKPNCPACIIPKPKKCPVCIKHKPYCPAQKPCPGPDIQCKKKKTNMQQEFKDILKTALKKLDYRSGIDILVPENYVIPPKMEIINTWVVFEVSNKYFIIIIFKEKIILLKEDLNESDKITWIDKSLPKVITEYEFQKGDSSVTVDKKWFTDNWVKDKIHPNFVKDNNFFYNSITNKTLSTNVNPYKKSELLNIISMLNKWKNNINFYELKIKKIKK